MPTGCTVVTPNGPCRSPALLDGDVCFAHSEGGRLAREAGAQARRRQAQAQREQADAVTALAAMTTGRPLPTGSIPEIRAALSALATAITTGAVNPKVALALERVLRTALAAAESDQSEAIADLRERYAANPHTVVPRRRR